MVSTARHVIVNDGFLGLWRGLVPSLARTVPGIGIYFSCMSSLRTAVCGSETMTSSQALFIGTGVLTCYKPCSRHLLLGASSRSIAGTLLIPVTVIKTRVESGLFQYGSVREALAHIRRQEGVRGLSAGLLPTLARDAPFSGLYLMFYSGLKDFFLLRSGSSSSSSSLSSSSLFLCGVTAGALSCWVTHPADVVKTRVQLYTKVGLLQAVEGVWRSEGARGFFAGFVPRMVSPREITFFIKVNNPTAIAN